MQKIRHKYLYFEFTDIDIDGEQLTQCLIRTKILVTYSMKPNELQKHRAQCVGKTLDFFP
jgi:hypothetical protein